MDVECKLCAASALTHKSKNTATQFYRVPVLLSNYQRRGHTTDDRTVIMLIPCNLCGFYSISKYFYIEVVLLPSERLVLISIYKQTPAAFKEFQRSNSDRAKTRRFPPREGIIYEWQRRCAHGAQVSSHKKLQIFVPRAHTIIKLILRGEYFPRRLLTFSFQFPRIVANFRESEAYANDKICRLNSELFLCLRF